MSFILDALRKSQEERDATGGVQASSRSSLRMDRGGDDGGGNGGMSLKKVIALAVGGVAVMGMLALGAFLLLSDEQEDEETPLASATTGTSAEVPGDAPVVETPPAVPDGSAEGTPPETQPETAEVASAPEDTVQEPVAPEAPTEEGAVVEEPPSFAQFVVGSPPRDKAEPQPEPEPEPEQPQEDFGANPPPDSTAADAGEEPAPDTASVPEPEPAQEPEPALEETAEPTPEPTPRPAPRRGPSVSPVAGLSRADLAAAEAAAAAAAAELFADDDDGPVIGIEDDVPATGIEATGPDALVDVKVPRRKPRPPRSARSERVATAAPRPDHEAPVVGVMPKPNDGVMAPTPPSVPVAEVAEGEHLAPPPGGREASTAKGGSLLDRGRQHEASGEMDLALVEYTRVLRRNPDSVEARVGRGWTYIDKGQYDEAIQDFTKVVSLQPKNGGAYFARALANERKGLYGQAGRDYARAMRLDPRNVDALFGRGVVAFERGQYERAASDFESVLERGRKDLVTYGLLWRYVARARAGDDGKEALREAQEQLEAGKWPRVIADLFAGKATPEQVEAGARNDDRPRQRERLCVAYFFLGQYHLMQGRKTEAAQYFRKTVDTGVTGYRQYWAAQAELRRIGAP